MTIVVATLSDQRKTKYIIILHDHYNFIKLATAYTWFATNYIPLAICQLSILKGVWTCTPISNE